MGPERSSVLLIRPTFDRPKSVSCNKNLTFSKRTHYARNPCKYKLKDRFMHNAWSVSIIEIQRYIMLHHVADSYLDMTIMCDKKVIWLQITMHYSQSMKIFQSQYLWDYTRLSLGQQAPYSNYNPRKAVIEHIRRFKSTICKPCYTRKTSKAEQIKPISTFLDLSYRNR